MSDKNANIEVNLNIFIRHLLSRMIKLYHNLSEAQPQKRCVVLPATLYERCFFLRDWARQLQGSGYDAQKASVQHQVAVTEIVRDKQRGNQVERPTCKTYGDATNFQIVSANHTIV